MYATKPLYNLAITVPDEMSADEYHSDINLYRATLAQLELNLNFHVKDSNVADAKQTCFHAAERDTDDNRPCRHVAQQLLRLRGTLPRNNALGSK